MSDEMGEKDPLNGFVERWAPEYNKPPETPTEEIWEGVQAALWPDVEEENVLPLRSARRREHRTARRVWWLAAVGTAAALVLGFGLGRLSAPGGAGAPAQPDVATTQVPSAFRTAALDHFSETESFLTLVRGDARAGRVGPGVRRWAEGLLSQTRLLLDSPAARDPDVRSLLEDLELVLVQVVGVESEATGGQQGERARRELNLLAQGIDDRDVLPRLQVMVPAGSVSM